MKSRLVGIDPDNGDLEWQYEFKGTNMAQPIWNPKENMLFISALGINRLAQARLCKGYRDLRGRQVYYPR